MSIRLDPRRLGALKVLAAEAGVRPGELVIRWVEERLDAARSGAPAAPAGGGDALAALTARVDELFRRLDQIGTAGAAGPGAGDAAADTPVAEPKRRGRPPKAAGTATAAKPKRRRSPRATAEKVALHDEIVAVIAERGPQSAAELATAIAERGRYHAPRSAKPLDAATVNARVSNPIYRGRFVRRERRIGLAAE
jgi:hypothetical protein